MQHLRSVPFVRITDDSSEARYTIHAPHGFRAEFTANGLRWDWKVIAPCAQTFSPFDIPLEITVAQDSAFSYWLAEFQADRALREFTDNDIRLPFAYTGGGKVA